MTTSAPSKALGALLVLALAGAASANVKPWLCPPKQFDSVAGFDLMKYIAAPWYVQSQTELKYQPKNNLFCVRAKYIMNDPKNPAKGVRVCNYANQGGVNKSPMGTCLNKAVTLPAALPAAAAKGAALPAAATKGAAPAAPFEMVALPWPARRSDPTTAASKLLVGPTALLASKSAEDLAKPPPPGQPRLAGPYWVVAVGKSKNATLGYDWAIVSGGAPSQATENDACIPPTKSDDGLWLFSRTPVASPAVMSAMLAAAKTLRLDTSKLLPVVQTGCTYAGAMA